MMAVEVARDGNGSISTKERDGTRLPIVAGENSNEERERFDTRASLVL
jgi:hypothetical protein